MSRCPGQWGNIMLPNTFTTMQAGLQNVCPCGCFWRGFHAASTGLSKTFTTGTNHRFFCSVPPFPPTSFETVTFSDLKGSVGLTNPWLHPRQRTRINNGTKRNCGWISFFLYFPLYSFSFFSVNVFKSFFKRFLKTLFFSTIFLKRNLFASLI